LATKTTDQAAAFNKSAENNNQNKNKGRQKKKKPYNFAFFK